MPETTSIYEPRDPTHSILYHLVQDHFETFRAQAASLRDGEGLPRFVEREFREFLTCGSLAAGFARFHCDACGHARPNVTEYVLTEAGNDLAEVIKHLGTWAIKWVFNDPNRDELDPALFLWKMHQRVNDREFPRRRTVVQFDLTGRKGRRVWLTLVPGDVSSSLKPPGFESDLIVRADVSVLYRVWGRFCRL